MWREAEQRAGGRDDMKFMNRLRALVSDDSGQDMLEYALLTALIALAAVVAVRAAGVQVGSIFTNITTALTN
jgi:pilus assembly protein Flp/PilA